MFDIIILILATEACVELWKKAAPLDSIKLWLVAHTPWLYSRRQDTHMLLCPYCFSLYVAAGLFTLYFLIDVLAIRCIIYILVIHRCSNYIHLVFSLIRDKQLDIRVARRRG
jgi:hypothetical protein